MIPKSSPACVKFFNRLGQSIAVGQYLHDDMLKEMLMKREISNEAKIIYSVSKDKPLSMYDITKPAFDVLPLFRFIYLMSLMEAFFKEYIAEREGVDIDVISSATNTEKSNWDKQKQGFSSFYNLKFVNFLTNSKYGIDFSIEVKLETMEMGALRNCIVHHDGKLISQYWIDELKHTTSAKGLPTRVGAQIEIDPKLITIFIEDTKKIAALLDYN